jgi:hypothetical protein
LVTSFETAHLAEETSQFMVAEHEALAAMLAVPANTERREAARVAEEAARGSQEATMVTVAQETAWAKEMGGEGSGGNNEGGDGQGPGALG